MVNCYKEAFYGLPEFRDSKLHIRPTPNLSHRLDIPPRQCIDYKITKN